MLLVAPLTLAPALAGCGTDPAQLAVGACISNPGGTNSSHRVNVVPCRDPHYGQIIGEVVVPDGNYPGSEVLTTECRDTCREAFIEAVGTPPEQSVFDLFPLLPSEDSWNTNNDRTIYCVVRSSTGAPLTETLSETQR